MQTSNNDTKIIKQCQNHIITSPALKMLLQKESNIHNSSVNDHLEIIQARKRQELNDYILVCTQRLESVIDPTRNLHDTSTSEHNFVHSIVKRTCRLWCS